MPGGRPTFAREKPGDRKSITIPIEIVGMPLIDLFPVAALAAFEPARLVIEGRAGEILSGLGRSLVNASIVIGEIEITIQHHAVDRHQVVRLVTAENPRHVAAVTGPQQRRQQRKDDQGRES